MVCQPMFVVAVFLHEAPLRFFRSGDALIRQWTDPEVSAVSNRDASAYWCILTSVCDYARVLARVLGGNAADHGPIYERVAR